MWRHVYRLTSGKQIRRCLVVLFTLVSTIAVFCSISGCTSKPTELEHTSIDLQHEMYSIAISEDGQLIALGAKTDQARDDASLLLLLNSQSLYFNGISTKLSQWVSQIEFVSNEFGFLLGCSIDPSVAGREEWQIVPGRLERFGLDGSREVIVDSIPSPISSLSISPNRRLAAVCNSAATDANSAVADENAIASCRFYSLDDGSLISTFVPQDPTKVKSLKAAFVDDMNFCLLITQPMHWADRVDRHIHAYLVEANSGKVLQDAAIHDHSDELYGLVSSPATGEAFVAMNGEIGRFKVKDGKFEFEERFYMSSRPYWIDYHAGTGRLAVAVSNDRREMLSVQIVDVKTRTAFKTQINAAGPLRFAPDGKSLYILNRGVVKYELGQLR